MTRLNNSSVTSLIPTTILVPPSIPVPPSIMGQPITPGSVVRLKRLLTADALANRLVGADRA
jgi:hypothetical protein